MVIRTKMAILNICNNKIECLTLFYYVAHFVGLLCAITLVLMAYVQCDMEKKAVGDFDFQITFSISTLVYVVGVFIVLTVTVGYLAQRWPDKSSLWILYCIFLSVLSVLVLTASVSALSRATSRTLVSVQMKKSMEKYEDDNKDDKWKTLHAKYNCCGTFGYKDWQDVPFGMTSLQVPNSCCLPERFKNDSTYCGFNMLPHTEDANKKIYTKGCYEPALKEVRHMLRYMSGLGFFVAGAHTLLTLLSCYLVVSKKV